MSDWWQHPYAGGKMVPVPGFPREVRVGDPDGPDVVAYKRTVWRAGRWEGPASRFDDTYSRGFSEGSGPNVIETGVAGVQRQQNMPADGVVNQATFNTLRSIRVPEGKPHEGEMAMDSLAVSLIAEAYDLFRPPTRQEQQEAAQRTIQDYCRRALANTLNWHYRQARPMESLGDNPDGVIYSDCSEGVTAAYYWANAPDPNGCDYNGYGYTETLWENNPETPSPYRVGDLALYSSSGGHVTVCIQAGDTLSSRWWSNGSEGGPYQEQLTYRSDLRGVVRPDLLT